MTAADFYDWKKHPVTVLMVSQMASQVRELQEILSEQAGVDPSKDRYHAGYIAAFNDFIRAEFVEESTE